MVAAEAAAPCRLGLLALGDSITGGDGDRVFGVHCRSWALWLAQALELPYTNHAVNGARAADVARDQLPRVRTQYDVACLHVGVNDARAADWDAATFERAYGELLDGLAAHAARVLVCTLPRDLGRPRAGGVAAANAAILRLAGAHADTTICDLCTLGGRTVLLPDAVHPTALGQLAIAARAADALAAAGMAPARTPWQLAAPRLRAGPGEKARYAAYWTAQLARHLARRAREAHG